MASESSNSASPDMAEHVDTISPARATSNIAPPETVLADKAAKFISEHGEIAFSYEDERVVLKLVDMRVLPLLLGAYFFQQLDKSSLSYVSIFGIIQDANLASRKIFLFPSLVLAALIRCPVQAP